MHTHTGTNRPICESRHNHFALRAYVSPYKVFGNGTPRCHLRDVRLLSGPEKCWAAKGRVSESLIVSATQGDTLEAGNDVSEDRRVSSADTARTIVDIMSHGTLASLNEDGTPLATYVSYILEAGGQPLLRLRADALHRENLERAEKCSLFIQPQDFPARNLARVTLIGRAEPVDDETAASARALHKEMASEQWQGVDAPQESDHIYRLVVEKCFYVGGMGTSSEAEVIAADEYRKAQPDALRNSAPLLVEFFNRDRADDVLRIASMASGGAVEQIYHAELLWVDSWGAYVAVEQFGFEISVHRVPFQRAVMDERDARSVLTLLAQFAWEEERHYSPPIPETIAF